MRFRFLACLILAAAPAALAASPAMPAPIGPIVKDGVEITVVPTVGAAAGPGMIEVTLDVEARADVAAQRLGFRSMRGVTELNCSQGSNRFVRADAFTLADLAGPSTSRPVSGQWVQPSPESFMYAVTARVCANLADAQSAPTGHLPVVTLGGPDTAAPATTATATLTPAATAAPPPPPARAAPPQHIAMAAAPRPAPSPSPPSSPPSFHASASGRGVAQVAASPTAQAAQHELDRLRALITPPLTSGVEAAKVGGAQVFRASVSGFDTLKDAQAFCARAASVSKTCWVHWKAVAVPPAKPGHP